MNESVTESWSPDGRLPPDMPGFDLIREIGEGGFGRVWLATNQATGGLVALKIIPLRSEGSRDPGGREIKSLTHLEAVRRIHHPNLLDIRHIEILPRPRFLFYTMDLADDLAGGAPSSAPDYQPATLKKRLELGPLKPDECLRYAHQLLKGLAFLHDKAMVHRDVKPANCLFVEGQLKLADFGLLTKADPQVSQVGTRQYMPPDGRMDSRADVYAAGLMIYEMVTGLPTDTFPHLGEMGPEVAEDRFLGILNRLSLRACDPDPERRFQDAREMLAKLEAATQPRPPRRRLILLIIGALLAIVLAVAGFWLSRPRLVHVNFITEPWDASVYLDGEAWAAPDGSEYKTPCTIPDLPARTHHVAFKREGWVDFDAGRIDFAKMREITARMSVDPAAAGSPARDVAQPRSPKTEQGGLRSAR